MLTTYKKSGNIRMYQVNMKAYFRTKKIVIKLVIFLRKIKKNLRKKEF